MSFHIQFNQSAEAKYAVYTQTQSLARTAASLSVFPSPPTPLLSGCSSSSVSHDVILPWIWLFLYRPRCTLSLMGSSRVTASLLSARRQSDAPGTAYSVQGAGSFSPHTRRVHRLSHRVSSKDYQAIAVQIFFSMCVCVCVRISSPPTFTVQRFTRLPGCPRGAEQ